jgi:hypothetical protein
VSKTYAIASALGPSRAGPMSDRVVKPEALKYDTGTLALITALFFSTSKLELTLDRDQLHN